LILIAAPDLLEESKCHLLTIEKKLIVVRTQSATIARRQATLPEIARASTYLYYLKYHLGAAPDPDPEVGETIETRAATEEEIRDPDPDLAPATAGETMEEMVAVAGDILVRTRETDAAITAEASPPVAVAMTREEADLLKRREALLHRRLRLVATTSESDL
jgi:hypothetical protein